MAPPVPKPNPPKNTRHFPLPLMSYLLLTVAAAAAVAGATHGTVGLKPPRFSTRLPFARPLRRCLSAPPLPPSPRQLLPPSLQQRAHPAASPIACA